MATLPDPISFASAQEKFINQLKSQKRSSATVIAYSGDLQQLRTFLESHRITQATTVLSEHLEQFVVGLTTQNYTAKSISRKINSLKTFFKFLHQSELIAANPATPLTHPKLENKPPHILTPTEVKNLRDACRLDIRISAIVELLLQTGMRISELANLRLEDIKKNEVFIGALENNPSRTVPLAKPALSAVQNYLAVRSPSKDDHLFVTKTGKPLLIRNIRTAIDRYFQKAGVPDAKVNDLRHTFIAFQLSHGLNPEIIHKYVGHRRLTSTSKYLDHVQISVTVPSLRLMEL